MAYWLLKSEPFKYSWAQLNKDGSTFWDGVRNYTARNHLAAMAMGDEGLFYHSNEGKCVVGVVRVVATAAPDPTVLPDERSKDGSNPWVGVRVAPLRALPVPVTLEMVRQEPKLAGMGLLKYSRLSVQPVTAAEWRVVLGLGGLK
jgi:predicted RNA-binding protein with PUA-like domain